ncbi:DUF402 domain-containing protein [Rossellomorea vietnamensis]|uniref:DUF402 domain-containing protein n=1 Tax=Rossellomorea vietnamensis TaxID=218284 RepID=A0A5D4KFM0_9BACI|nr:DUF402 domain-containing protein [Rossellomorea vietnamensis]TYR76087.1 DUF402 domain-containing protein [Rossellomorea vietnamensis]
MNVVVYWNHVGREHGGLKYTKDIRKNSEEVITKALSLKKQYALKNENGHRFLVLEESLIIELPHESSDKKFIIIYMLDLGLQFSYGFKSSHDEWLIDIVQFEQKAPGLVCVHDLLIDIRVFEDGSYHVIDMDEFHEAYRLGVLSEEQVKHSLNALSHILHKLNQKNFPGRTLEEIKSQYY